MFNHNLYRPIRLEKQSTPYTCACAALVSAARLLGVADGIQEMDVAKDLKARKKKGVKVRRLGEFAIHQLGAMDFGSDIWDGEVAIAVVDDKQGGFDARTVLLLGQVSGAGGRFGYRIFRPGDRQHRDSTAVGSAVALGLREIPALVCALARHAFRGRYLARDCQCTTNTQASISHVVCLKKTVCVYRCTVI